MAGDPVALPGLAILWLGFPIFLAALLAARRRKEPGPAETGARTSYRSVAGIVVQGIAIGLAGFGRESVSLDPLSAMALGEAVVIALLMISTIGLFFWASRSMGRNWSIVARTRQDHALVTAGPFAHVRHPIYVALFAMMLALAIGTGHTRTLIGAIPLYALGTWLRIAEEERLIREKFGSAYDRYAARVARFVPGVF